VGGYAFGDSEPAARRLGLLADVFEPPSRAFLTRFAAEPVDLAVDLGCGPGHSTRLVASVLGARRTLGLDQSASFVALAEADAPPGVEFAVHDVTVVPFPASAAGLVYGRFLLTHLHDPPAALAAWATQLAPGGLLLADEVERIHTSQPALRRYLEVAGPCSPPAATGWRSAPPSTASPTRRAWSAATTRSPTWPRRHPGRPSCSPRTWPCGATRRSRPGSRPGPTWTSWPAPWPRSTAARSPGSSASWRSGGPEPCSYPACSSAMIWSHRSRHWAQMAAAPCATTRPLSGSQEPQKLHVRPG
jgi:SAM-dependent methyltransferase